MSHTVKKPFQHKDWWTRRPFSGISVRRRRGMKDWKRATHKIERKTWRTDPEATP